MAHPARPRPRRIANFDHQLLTNPLDLPVERIAGEEQFLGRRCSQWLSLAPTPSAFDRKARPYPAGVLQMTIGIVIAQVQRADAGARSGWRRPPEHHHFLPPQAFHLDPRAAASRAVRQILLADDPLKAQPASSRCSASAEPSWWSL